MRTIANDNGTAAIERKKNIQKRQLTEQKKKQNPEAENNERMRKRCREGQASAQCIDQIRGKQ